MANETETPDLDELYRANAARLRGRFMRMTRDPVLADDLVAEAFARLAAELRAGRMPDDPWPGCTGSVEPGREPRSPGDGRRPGHAAARAAGRGSVARGRGRSATSVTGCCTRCSRRSGDDRWIVVLAAQGYRSEEIAG